MQCGKKCEVYSRVVGYFRPTSNWNKGKIEEWEDRVPYSNKITVTKNEKE